MHPLRLRPAPDWLSLSRALGVGQTAPATCPDMGLVTALFTTTCDWRVSDLVLVFSIGIVVQRRA